MNYIVVKSFCCLSKQARSCKEQMNVNIIPKCIWKLILQLCVTSKCSVLIFTRLSQLLRPIKLTTNTIVNESEYKAESKRRDKCLRRAEQAGGKVKGAAVCGNSWTNRDWDKERTLFCKNSHLFQAPPPPTKANNSCRVWNTWSDGPKSERERREWEDASSGQEGGPQALALLRRGFEKSFQGAYTKSPFKSAP